LRFRCVCNSRLPLLAVLHAQHSFMIRIILYTLTVALILAWLAAVSAVAQTPKDINDVWNLLHEYGVEGPNQTDPEGLAVRLIGASGGGAPEVNLSSGAQVNLAAGAGVRVNNEFADAAWVRWSGQNVGVYNATSDPLRVVVSGFEGSASVQTWQPTEAEYFNAYSGLDSKSQVQNLEGYINDAATQKNRFTDGLADITPEIQAPSSQQTTFDVPFAARGAVQASSLRIDTSGYSGFRTALVFLEGLWFMVVLMRYIREGVA